MIRNDFLRFAKSTVDVYNSEFTTYEERAQNAGLTLDVLKEFVDERKDVIITTGNQPSRILGASLAFADPDSFTEIDEDDAIDYIDGINDFLDDVGEENFENENYIAPTNMSINLLKLFQVDLNKEVPLPVGWKAPTTHGLSNSEPIIPTKGNYSRKISSSSAQPRLAPIMEFSNDSSSSSANPSAQNSFIIPNPKASNSPYATNDTSASSSKGFYSSYNNNDGYNRMDTTSTAEAKQYNPPGATSFSTKGEKDVSAYSKRPSDEDEDKLEEDEEEDEDEDDDGSDEGQDEEGDGYDDENLGNLVGGNMSVSLMQALGLDTAGRNVETDWKPPTFSGVANSDRLIR